MSNKSGGISEAGVQAIIYFAIGFVAFVLILVIMTSIMGSNVKGKKITTAQAKPNAEPAEKPCEELKQSGYYKESEVREGATKLVEEIQAREQIIKLFEEINAHEETSSEKTGTSELNSSTEIEETQSLMAKPTKPKKHRKIKMPRNTGGG